MFRKILEARSAFGDPLGRCGSVQLLFGLVSLVLGFVALGIDRGKFEDLEMENGNVTDIIIGLDCGCLFSSLVFIYTGLVPFTCCSCFAGEPGSVEFVRKKVKFMVACIVSASVFVPIVMCCAVATFLLRGKYGEKYLGLTGLALSVALIQFIVCIIASAYCCCGTPWSKKCKCKKEKRYKHMKASDNPNEKEEFVVKGLDKESE